jgi:hypothetical protein
MRKRRYTIIKLDQVDIGLPFQSAKEWNKTWLPKGSIHFHWTGPNAPRIGFSCMGALDTETGAPRMSPTIREATERLFNNVDASACGVIVPR